MWSFQCTWCSRLLFYRTSLTSRHSSGGQWLFTNNTHCSSKTNRAHSQVDRHSSNLKFLPKHYFDIRTIYFFRGTRSQFGWPINSDIRHVLAEYDKRESSAYSSKIRPTARVWRHPYMEITSSDVTRTWDLRARNSARTWSVLGELHTSNASGNFMK